MPSRLSSLLVRDGVVDVKRVERAFQRQVIYGGALDTNLLEMNAATENQLIQYASLATGIPPATRSDLEKLDPAMAERCPESLSLEHGVVPLASERQAMQVLVRDPVSLEALEALAEKLDTPVEPLLVLEYRFFAARGRVYDIEVDSRFSKLAVRMTREQTAATPGVGAESIVVDSPAHRRQPGGAASPRRRRSSSKPPRAPSVSDAHVSESETGGRAAVLEAATPAPSADASSASSGGDVGAELAGAPVGDEAGAREEFEPEALAGSAPLPKAAGSGEVQPEPADSPAPNGHAAATSGDGVALSAGQPGKPASPGGAASVPAQEPAPGTAAREAAASSAPLGPREARRLLAGAEHRDDVFLLLLRALRSQTAYAALLTIQGDAAIGRVAVAEDPALTAGIRETLIPLDVASPFKQVVSSDAPYIGPIATADDEVNAMISRLGGTLPPAALLLPVSLRGRVVAIAVGHRGTDPLEISECSGILPVAADAAGALHRILASRKTGGSRHEAAAVPEAVSDEPPTSRLAKYSAPRSEAPEPSSEEENPIDAFFAALARDDGPAAVRARKRALAASEATLKRLGERFPGPLELDRHNLGSRLRPAPDHGPLLELLVEIGEPATPIVLRELRSDDPAHRYYAALCAGAVQPGEALDRLVDLLFDADAGARAAAIEALAGYPQSAREGALARVREVLAEIDEARVGAAAIACAELCHEAAIPALIEALAHGTAPSPVRRALVSLTKQDFGASSRKWRSWWSRNRSKSRIEWMIDGLAHKDADVRRSAIEELRRLTGEYFGYHHDLPKKERNDARQRWERWWQESGRHSHADLERRTSALRAPSVDR